MTCPCPGDCAYPELHARLPEPEREHGLVSIGEMNRRIAAAVQAERVALAGIVRSYEFDLERNISRSQACREILRKIRERGMEC